MGYTPRQIAAWMTFARRRRRRELSEAITVAAMGARGDQKALKKLFADLERE